MAAGNGMNMAVGLDLSQLQKDLKVLDKDLNSITGQEKVVKIRPIIETTKINQATGEAEKCAREGFEPLYKSIKRLEEAQKGLRFSVNGNLFNVSTMKEAQRALTQLRKEFNALEKNGGMTVDLRRQYTDGISALAEWQKATKDATKQLGQFGFIDYDREAGRIKNLRAAINREMKAARAEMDQLGSAEPVDLKRREELLTRLISLQEKYNKTYKHVSSQKQQLVTDLRAEREAIRLKQSEYTIQQRINSLNNDRANARTLASTIGRIRAEQTAVRGLISAYGQLAIQQKKRGASTSVTDANISNLKKEYAALKNAEDAERARQKAVNQNNALFNDQHKVFEKLWTAASRYISIFTLWNFGQKIIETTGYFQQQQVALEGILGSASKAEKAIQRIRNMALNSPKTTYELVGYTKQLAAYDVGGQDPDKLLDVVHQLAELSTGLGVDMQRLILAYGQVNAASVLRGQELRQFTEAGIPMVQALADKFTQLNGHLVTTGEVFELISKRQVSFEMVASVLRDMTAEGGKFYEMQSRVTDTLYGQMQKLKDLWTINLDNLGKSTGGLLGNIVSALQGIVKNIRPIANSLLTFSLLKTAAKWFSAIVILSGSLNRNLAHAQWQMRNFYRQVRAASGAMATMKAIARGITSGGVVGAAFNAALLALSAIVGLIVKARQKTKEWNRTLDEINTSFAKDTVALTSGLDKLIGKLQTLNKDSKEYKDTLDTLKSNYGEYVNDGIVQSLLKEAEAADSAAISWGKLAEAIKQAVFEKKEYERNETIKNTAIDNIIGDIEGKLENLSNVVRDKNRTSYMVDDTGREFATYNEIGNELKQKNAQKALSTAAREYLTLGATEDQLPAIIDKWAKRYGFTPETAAALSGESGSVLKSIKRSSYYDKYAESESYITSALQNVINRAFQDASQRISDNYKVYTGVRGKNYDPFGINEFSTKQYVEALQGLIYSNYIPKSIQDGLANNKAYQDALKLSDSDQGKTLAIVNAIDEFIRPLKDSDLVTNLKAIVGAFTNNAGTNGTDAARVRTRLSDYYIFSGMNLTDNEKDYLKQFEPTDQTIFDMPKKITEEYQKMEAFINEHPDKNGTYAGRIAEYERLMSLLKVLAKPEYYNLGDLSKKSGFGRTPREFPDFFNIFKNAYDQYKRAAQQGGVVNAVNEFRSDPTLRKQYGDMFGISGSIDAFGFKIGDKTVADIIKENLIEGGIEDGVVDFQKAAQKTAETLLSYGRANEKERGAFIRLGEQIQKWVTETFTKDTITTWLDEFGKSVQNLTVSFDNMRSNIDLARKMSEQGTLGYFGGVAGIAGEVDITKPQSAVQRDYIAGLLSKYNSFSASTAVNGSMPDLFELGDINSLSDIESTIKRLNGILLDVNNEAFKAFPQGEAIVKELVNALKNLDKTVRDEASKVSGKSYTGNKLFDTVRNASISGENADIVNQEAQRIAQANGLGVDLMAIKARVETAQKGASDVLSAYLEANNFDAMFAAYRQPIDIDKIKQGALQQTKDLPYLEQQAVLKKLDELERNVEAFNAARGDFAPFFNGLTDYRTADSRAKAEWERLSTDKAAIAAGATFNAETNMFDKNNITDPETLAYIDMLNQKLEEVGANGVKLAKVFKDQALNNVKAFCTTAQSSLDAMSGVVKNLVSSVQAVVKAFSKAYDVMNDGENPKWMQDTEAFLGDFAENFEAMIAPMSAVIALIVAITVAITVCEAVATPLLIVMAAVVAAAAILAAIIAAFQQHDRKLEHSIEGLKEDVEAFDRAITNLQAAAERGVGFEKLRKNIAATGKELEKATAYAEMARLEEEKKNTDNDKVKEYKQSYQEAMDSFLNSMREVRNELVSSTEDWANAMGSAIRSAFQNGENAARAFRNTVKTMIGDVIENMLEMAILQPLIENALENWTNSDYLRQKFTKEWTEKDENGKEIKRSKLELDGYMNELLERIGNPELSEEFYQSMLMIGDTLIDTVNGMHPFLKDAYMHNSELGTLSGGIESVTEDTARRIEALENSQLGEVFAIRMMLQNYLEGSGFGDSMTADLQAAIVSIASDTNLIRIATESILARIDQMRTSNVQPLHVTIV